MHLWCGGIAVQVQIDHAINALHQTLGLLKNAAQRRNIRAKQLENHLTTRTRCGLFHAVTDRLRKVKGHPRNFTQRCTHFLDQRGLVQALAPFAMRLEAYQHLGKVERLVIGARFRSPLLCGHCENFREDLETQAYIAQHFLAFFQRDGSRHLHQYIGIAFIQLRQKFGAQPFGRKTSHHQHAHKHGDHCGAAFGGAQNAANPVLITVVRTVKDLGFFHHHMLGLEQQRAQRRHQAHGKHQRTQQRKAVGHGQRTEDAAFNALQREHRDQGSNHDRHGKQRGLGHGNGRVHNDVAHIIRCLRFSQPRVAKYVLGQHHRTIHHDAEVDRAHRNQISRHAQRMQADKGDQQRQRNHRRHDQRATQAA